MTNIEVKVLNPTSVTDGERLYVLAARLTQRNQSIANMSDLLSLYDKPYTPALVERLCELPHPTLQKFSTITIAIVGASRRFLAQITRYQNEVKFMSGSLQYSDMSQGAAFVTPYNIRADAQAYDDYHRYCKKAHAAYVDLIQSGLNHDDAGYIMPQGMRNVLLISATPYQWKHMIRQRICRRNSDETRYVMLLCWKALLELNPTMFDDCLPPCSSTDYNCPEGDMSCGSPLPAGVGPDDIIEVDFPIIKEHYDIKPLN